MSCAITRQRLLNQRAPLDPEADFAPVDFSPKASACCTCSTAHNPRGKQSQTKKNHCVIHSENSNWQPPAVLTREFTEIGLLIHEGQPHRFGTREITYAARNLEDFYKNFKVTEEHKERERLYEEKTKRKLSPPAPPETESSEAAPVSSPPPEAKKKGLWKRIRHGVSSLVFWRRQAAPSIGIEAIPEEIETGSSTS